MKKIKDSREGVCKSGRSMQPILSALLWFVKTMEGGKNGPEKYYYFLLPNNKSIQVGAQYLTTCGK